MDERTRIYTMHTGKLEDPAAFAAGFKKVSRARQKKIDRLKQPQEKRLSLACALLLDQGLLAYGLTEKEMDIVEGEHGKPYFANAPSIYFSLSHSGRMAMAVFSDQEIGCDIQEMKEFPSESRMMAIAKRFYTKKECDWIASSGMPLQRRIRFYRLWVLKESYAKARGEGIARALKDAGFLMEPVPSLEGKDRDFFRFTEYSFGGYRSALCLQKEI